VKYLFLEVEEVVQKAIGLEVYSVGALDGLFAFVDTVNFGGLFV
jgi:hypothetical protein